MAISSGLRNIITPADLSRQRSSWFDDCFVYFAMTVYSAAILPTLRYARGDSSLKPGDTEITATIAQIIIMILTFYILVRHWRRVIPILRYMRSYIIIVALCGASALWSEFPFQTIRRTVTLSVCVMFGTYLYMFVGIDRSVRLIARLMPVLGVLSIVAFFALPSIAQDNSELHTGAMRGVFSQKNGVGEAMLLGLVASIYLIIRFRTGIIRHGILVGFEFFCMGLSRSATCLIIAIPVVLGGALLYSRSPRSRLLIWFCGGVAVVGVLCVLTVFPEELFALLGRDSSFSGRLPLWETSFESFLQRPWLGFGYSGFWQDWNEVFYIWEMVGWPAPSAHNGYIDILLQLGVVGLGLYIYVWSRVIYLSLGALRSRAVPEASWILLFMIMNVILNTDEGPLPYPDQFTAMFPSAILILEQWAAQRHRLTMMHRNIERASPTSSALRGAEPKAVRP